MTTELSTTNETYTFPQTCKELHKLLLVHLPQDLRASKPPCLPDDSLRLESQTKKKKKYDDLSVASKLGSVKVHMEIPMASLNIKALC